MDTNADTDMRHENPQKIKHKYGGDTVIKYLYYCFARVGNTSRSGINV